MTNNAPPLFQGNFETGIQTVGEITRQHLLPEGNLHPGFDAALELTKVPAGVAFSPRQETVSFPTIEANIADIRRQLSDHTIDDSSRTELLEIYDKLTEKMYTDELTVEERLAEKIANPEIFYRNIVRRIRNIIDGFEYADQQTGLVQPGEHASVYFATQDMDRKDTVTKVSWFNRYAESFTMPERPKGVNRSQWLAYIAARAIIGSPLVRIYTCSDDEIESSKPIGVSGYSLSKVDGSIYEIRAKAFSVIDSNFPALKPYFSVPEATVEVTKEPGLLKLPKNLAKLPAHSGTPAMDRLLHLLPQINPENIIVGLGTSKVNRRKLAQIVQCAPLDKVLAIDRSSADFEKQVAKPDAFIF